LFFWVWFHAVRDRPQPPSGLTVMTAALGWCYRLGGIWVTVGFWK
jgi:hypothetical protein